MALAWPVGLHQCTRYGFKIPFYPVMARIGMENPCRLINLGSIHSPGSTISVAPHLSQKRAMPFDPEKWDPKNNLKDIP